MAEVLLVGADRSLTPRIARFLRQDRHIVHVLRDPERWRDAEATLEPELIVAAFGSPERILTGGRRSARNFPTPILLVQANPQLVRAAGGDERLMDRITMPFEPEELVARVDALVRARRAVARLLAESSLGAEGSMRRAGPAGLAWRFGHRVSSILNSRIPPFARPAAAYAGVAARVATWADRRDAFAPGHAERVAGLSALIAAGIGMPFAQTMETQRAALLHDIGKVTLPIAVLRQRGPLAEDQKRLVQTHAERGAAILAALSSDASTIAAIRHHHERFDGGGATGKRGRELPRSARILAVAEVYDAMTASELIPACGQDTAFGKIRELRGNQLDPDCVDALIDALRRHPTMSLPPGLRVAASPGPRRN